MSASLHPLRLTLASRVTILRILIIPVFVLFLIYYQESLKAGVPNETHRSCALLLFLLVAVTDALDGYLARSRNEITRLGKILDPIADKALMLSALVMLTRPSLDSLEPQFPIWFTLLAISRDFVLIIGAFLVQGMAGHVDIEPRAAGKVATALTMLSILCALAGLTHDVFYIIVFVAGIFTLIAGLQYMVDGLRQLERSHHPPTPPGIHHM